MSEKTDELTRCSFQRKNHEGEWVTYLIVGEYPMSKLSKILTVMLNMDGDIVPGKGAESEKNNSYN